MIKPTQLKRKYNTGGEIGSTVGTVAGSFIPGVGPMLGGLAGGLVGGGINSLLSKKPRDPKLMNYATQGYATGGQLPVTKPIGNNAVKYEGPQHEQGGIPIDDAGNPTDPNQATAEVEGGETRQDDYIFSDELLVPGEEITFAQMHEMLLSQGASPEEIDQLKQMQEQVRGEQGLTDQPEMQDGGKLKKYNFGGDTFNNKVKPRSFSNVTAAKPNVTLDQSKLNNPHGIADTNSGSNLAETAYKTLPSLTRLATAGLAPNRQKTRSAQPHTISERNHAFADGRNQLAAGFRANSSQGGYAQYIAGVNQLTAGQRQDELQREQFNAQTRSHADQFNIQNEVRDADEKAKSDASRIGLVAQAADIPATRAFADQRGMQNQITGILTSADQIPIEADRVRSIKTKLKAIGVDDAEIERILSNYKYGGKLKKKKG